MSLERPSLSASLSSQSLHWAVFLITSRTRKKILKSSICLQRPKPPTTLDTKSCGETTWSFGGAWVRRKDSAEVDSKRCFQGITATPEKHRRHDDLPRSSQYKIASLWGLSQLGPTLFLGAGLQRRVADQNQGYTILRMNLSDFNSAYLCKLHCTCKEQ